MSSQDQRSLKKLTEKTYNDLSYEIPKNLMTKDSNKINGFSSQQSIPKIYNQFHKLVRSVHNKRTANEENPNKSFRVTHMYNTGMEHRINRSIYSFDIDKSLYLENFNNCLLSSIKTNSNGAVKRNSELPSHKYHLLRKSLVSCSIRTPNKTPAHFKEKVKNAYDILAYKNSGFF